MGNHSIVFLDIDGVLNSTRFYEANKPLPLGQAGAIDPEACTRMNRLVSLPGVKTVLSTSWRHQGRDVVAGMLSSRGLRADIVGITPTLMRKPRSAEIVEWLYQADHLGFRWQRFLVVDDQADAFDQHMMFGTYGCFVNTNMVDGFTDECADIGCRWLIEAKR